MLKSFNNPLGYSVLSIAVSFCSAPFLASSLIAFAAQPPQDGRTASVAEYRRFATEREGNATAGREIFLGAGKQACHQCHTTDGSHRNVGPDLAAIGNKFEKSALITSVLEPSQTIAVGYGTTQLLKQDGSTVQGVLKRVTHDWSELLDQENKLIRVEQSEIDQQRFSDVSLMPENLHQSMTLVQFSDLIAYLASLRQSSGSQDQYQVARSVGQVKWIPVFKEDVRFEHPSFTASVPGQPKRMVILEQAGRMLVVDMLGDQKPRLLVDLSERVRMGGATGLLGLAFHPLFPNNGRLFLKYQTNRENRLLTVVEELRFSSPAELSGLSQDARAVIEIPATTQDHNGGCIEFGPDGYLYIGMGDSGPQRDPQGHGQDLQSLLGKILRIDVDQVVSGATYGVPPDNPFVNRIDARPEIWAYGFREPWRFSFDSLTHEMWVGDVGQDQIEEVSMVRRGENLGWNTYEGSREFSNDYRRPDERYVMPVFDYPRRLGVSVTGGYVYRGSQAPQLNGWYICGDFESRRIWAIGQRDRKLQQVFEIGRAPTRVVSFAQGSNGELWMVGYDDGILYQMDLSEIETRPQRAMMLAETSEQVPVMWRVVTELPLENWSSGDFDDSSWRQSPGGFGTVGTPGAIVRTDWQGKDIWLRREFQLPANYSPTGSISLLIHHDEDAEIYLNGVEAARVSRWTNGYVELPIAAQALATLKAGKNLLAIHCRQVSGGQYIDCGLIQYQP